MRLNKSSINFFSFLSQYHKQILSILGLVAIPVLAVFIDFRFNERHKELVELQIINSYFQDIGNLFTKDIDLNLKKNIIKARTYYLFENFKDSNKLGISVIKFLSNLDKSLLIGLEFKGADFSGADLRGLDFSETAFLYCNFSKTNLVGSKFNYSNLIGSNFYGSKMFKTYGKAKTFRISGGRTAFSGAKLESSIWVNGNICDQGSMGLCISKDKDITYT